MEERREVEVTLSIATHDVLVAWANKLEIGVPYLNDGLLNGEVKQGARNV